MVDSPDISNPGEEEQRIAAETRLVLEGLETFTYYLISVQAYNLAGEGPRSSAITARTSEGDEREFVTLQQEITSKTEAEVSLTNLNPNTGYQFRIIAINNQGISQPSVESDVFVTPSLAMAKLAKPFHTEWWFLVIIALTGVIVILVIISLLCLISRRKKAGKEMKRSQTNTTVVI
nr:hypothetical protein BaRGS_024943 [Batillaria attramentaria]